MSRPHCLGCSPFWNDATKEAQWHLICLLIKFFMNRECFILMKITVKVSYTDSIRIVVKFRISICLPSYIDIFSLFSNNNRRLSGFCSHPVLMLMWFIMIKDWYVFVFDKAFECKLPEFFCVYCKLQSILRIQNLPSTVVERPFTWNKCFYVLVVTNRKSLSQIWSFLGIDQYLSPLSDGEINFIRIGKHWILAIYTYFIIKNLTKHMD